MRALTASEAITPAIQRTKEILFQPFRKGRSWKLAAVAYLSMMGLAFVPYFFVLFAFPHGPAEQSNYATLLLAAACLIPSALMFLFFYLGSRLQFVLFAIVAEKSLTVAPLWRRYSSRTWPWLGLKLVLSLVVCAIFAAPVFYAFRSFATHMIVEPGQLPSPEMLGSLFLFYACLFLPIGLLMLCSSLLSDFVLPPIALEGAAISEAARRFGELIKAEPGQMAFYTLFKILLALAGVVAMQVVVLVAEIVALIPLGLMAALGWYLFRTLGPVGHVLLVAGGITLGLIFAVFLGYVAILVLGCFHMFYQAYALYFLGGRYPLLGDILEPPQHSLPEPPPLVEPAA
jgi:hypothetical protein